MTATISKRLPGLTHLRRLTDDTGITEHALGKIPRRKEGYSTDDQARALWASLELLELSGEQDRPLLLTLIDTYLAFMLWVQKEDGHYHNNIAYDRSAEPEVPSEDCLGRCLWASALAYCRLKDPGRRLAAETLLAHSLPLVSTLRTPRGWAHALAALGLLKRHGYHEDRIHGAAAASAFSADLADSAIQELARYLKLSYRSHAAEDWQWYEAEMTYSNGLLPWGLLWAYESTGDREALDIALRSLDFLILRSRSPEGHIRPIGNRGWCSRDSRALWDQQPIDVMKLMLACIKADELTGGMRYRETARACRDWFYGDNDAGVPLADHEEGSCCDGLQEGGANLNRGAESTLSYLLAEVMHERYLANEKQANEKQAKGNK